MALLAAPLQALRVFLCLLQLVQDIARLRRRSLRHSRQLDFPRPYIAARFRSLPSHFILGDMKHYDNFENRALEPGQRYVLFILAVLQEPEAVSAACLPSPIPVAALLASWRGFSFQMWSFWMWFLCLMSCLCLCLHLSLPSTKDVSGSACPGLCGQNLCTCGSRMGRNTELSPQDCTRVQRAPGQIPF